MPSTAFWDLAAQAQLQAPIFIMAMALLFGLAIGSFLNVVIHRLPKMLDREWRAQCAWLEGRDAPAETPYSLVRPRSACVSCGHALRWYENVPLLSWLWLRGRCSACGASISPRYPLVEAFTGLLFVLAVWRWGVSPQALAAWVLLAFLVALTFIDLDTFLLPDHMTLSLAWAGLLVNLFSVFAPLDEAVIGAIAGYLSLWCVFHLFLMLTGKEGMGFGDFKLLAALGAWLGWKLLLPMVLIASFAGALAGLLLLAFKRTQRDHPIPFGPWLALGGFVCLFWGEGLLDLWLGG